MGAGSMAEPPAQSSAKRSALMGGIRRRLRSFRRFLPTHTLETLGVVGVSVSNFLTVSIRIFWGLGYNPPNSYYLCQNEL